MPVKQTVYVNNPGKSDHGKPQVLYSVDAREMIARGHATRNPPSGGKREPDQKTGHRPSTEGAIVPPGSPDPAQNPDPAVDAGLHDLTQAKLLDLAKLLRIANTKTMSKDELIQAILAAGDADPDLLHTRDEFLSQLREAN